MGLAHIDDDGGALAHGDCGVGGRNGRNTITARRRREGVANEGEENEPEGDDEKEFHGVARNQYGEGIRRKSGREGGLQLMKVSFGGAEDCEMGETEIG